MQGAGMNPVAELYRSVSWYVLVRFLFLLALIVPGTLTLYLFSGYTATIKRDLLVAVAALLSNLVFWLLVVIGRHHARYQKALAAFWIVTDILLVTGLIYINGGIESRSQILYTVPILTGAAILGEYAGFISCLLSAGAYSSLLILIFKHRLPMVGTSNPMHSYSLVNLSDTIAFYSSVFFVIAMVATYLTRQLRKKSMLAEHNLNALVRAQEIARLGSWEWNLKTGQLSWSEELYKMWGLSDTSQQLDYEFFIAGVVSADRAMVNRSLHAALKTKQICNFEYRIKRIDGSIANIHAEAVPVLGTSGEVVSMTGIAQDVTDLKRLDIAKRDFVSLASHQLRTPATVVKVFLGLLKELHLEELTKTQAGFVSKAYAANERQLEIIDNLLSVAAIESGKLNLKKEVLDLRLVVRQVASNHESAAKQRQQKLVVKAMRQPIWVRADPSYLLMALDNLVSNACKYTPEKGRIDIALSTTKRLAVLSIADTGLGIPKQEQQHIFEKFTRIDRPENSQISGSGLGLYLVDNIMRLHRGTVGVKSREQRGTIFVLKLPRSTANKSKPTVKRQARQPRLAAR